MFDALERNGGYVLPTMYRVAQVSGEALAFRHNLIYQNVGCAPPQATETGDLLRVAPGGPLAHIWPKGPSVSGHSRAVRSVWTVRRGWNERYRAIVIDRGELVIRPGDTDAIIEVGDRVPIIASFPAGQPSRERCDRSTIA